MRPSVMRSTVNMSVWLLLAQMSWHLGGAERDPGCADERPSLCRRIGTRLPDSKCYKKHEECCATCSKLQTNIPGCPYGDRASGCGSIGGDRPVSDCYAENATCCGTCAAFSRGIPGCEFGDRLTTCSEIGIRYSVSSCYQEEQDCCDTCSRFKSNTPGCDYGDRENWCSLIGVEFCQSDPSSCCATCAKLLSTTAASLGNDTLTTIIPDQQNHVTKVSHTGVQTTYTGSPGRPRTSASATPSPPYMQHSSPTTHRTVSQTADLTPRNSTLDKSPNKTNSSNTRDSDVICYYVNATGHRIRHSKHGGRHRSRGHARPICVNVTSSPEVPTVPSTSEPLWLIISKGMPPQSSTTTAPPRTSKPNQDISEQEAGLTWPEEVQVVSMTTGLDSGWQGEMDYQEDPLSTYNSASHHSECAVYGLLQVCAFLVFRTV